MTITITPGATTPTTAVLNFAGYGGDGTIDLQLASRPDFSFCVAPVYNITRGPTRTITGLNQEAVIYSRARGRTAAGVERWGDTAGFRTGLAAARVTTAQPIMVEPASLVFPVPFLATAGTFTLPGFPTENVGIAAPVAWRSIVNSGGQTAIDLTTAGEPVDRIAVLNTNVPENGRISVAAGDNAASLVPIIDQVPFRASANVPGRPGYHGIFAIPLTTARFWRITFTIDGGPTELLLHIEHIVLGRNLASRNANGDKTETPVGLTTTERTRTGILDRVPGVPLRRAEFDLSNLTEREFETLYGQLWRRQGDTVFCLPNSKDNAFRHDRMLFGEFGAGRISGVQGIRFTRGMSIDSII